MWRCRSKHMLMMDQQQTDQEVTSLLVPMSPTMRTQCKTTLRGWQQSSSQNNIEAKVRKLLCPNLHLILFSIMLRPKVRARRRSDNPASQEEPQLKIVLQCRDQKVLSKACLRQPTLLRECFLSKRWSNRCLASWTSNNITNEARPLRKLQGQAEVQWTHKMRKSPHFLKDKCFRNRSLHSL